MSNNKVNASMAVNEISVLDGSCIRNINESFAYGADQEPGQQMRGFISNGKSRITNHQNSGTESSLDNSHLSIKPVD
jgi:hypothetical protein